MMKQNFSNPSINQLPEAMGTIARRAENAARDVADTATAFSSDVSTAAKDATEEATETAKDMYHSVTRKAEDALMTSKDYVRRHPIPVVIGTIFMGAAVGYLLVKSWHKPTFRERYADEPLDAVREVILGALSPVSRTLRRGYDSAREVTGSALDEVHRLNSKHARNSLSDRLGRIGDNLKFW